MTETPHTTESQAEKNQQPASPDPQPRKKGPLHWLRVNLTKILGGFIKRHKLGVALAAVTALVCVFLTRALWQHYVLAARQQSGVMLILLVVLIIAVFSFKFKRRALKYGLPLLCLLSIFGYAFCVRSGYDPYEYLQLWYRFKTLSCEELSRMPQTDFERIQPQNAIYNLSKTKVADSESLTRPDFVKIGADYRWTIAIEPKYWQNRLSGDVREVFNVPATEPSPSFSKENRVSVHFNTGEHLYLGRNVFTNTVKTFGLWRFLHLEPVEVKYIANDKGQWVQAVSLVRWKGIFFPRPEFGGVHIIEQIAPEEGVWAWLKMILVGKGYWIAPEKIGTVPFLKGQNLIPERVSRFNAKSLRFKNGFFAPFPGRHRGDIRIPDLPSDANNQPFTTYFKFSDPARNKLYHYFSLEPFHMDRHGLNTSLMIPADGMGPVYVYYHADRDEALTGVSAVAAKVMDTKKNYGWGNILPVEYRPWIKQINGKTRFFWLTTVVTKTRTPSEQQEGRDDPQNKPDNQPDASEDAHANQNFLTGSVPEIALMDAERDIVVWVDPLKPNTWISQIMEAFSDLWQ